MMILTQLMTAINRGEYCAVVTGGRWTADRGGWRAAM